jgi:hypothetical protein
LLERNPKNSSSFVIIENVDELLVVVFVIVVSLYIQGKVDVSVQKDPPVPRFTSSTSS